MPRVPQTDNVVPMQQQAEMPSPTMFAIAAATMHQEGRLFAQADNIPAANSSSEFEAAVRKHGEVRANPNQPSMKEFMKNLPDDMEIDDKSSDTGRGPGESIRIRLKKDPVVS